MSGGLTFGSFLAPNVWPVYQSVAAAVGNRLGVETRLITGSSLSQFESGEIDVGFICSPAFLRLASRGLVRAIAAPVLQGARYRGMPIYFSDVIVRSDSPARDFEDLRGYRLSFNDSDSYSGYIAPLLHLAQRDQGPDFFGRWVEAGSHQASIQLVLSGQADTGAIDSQVLEIESRRPEVAAGLRTVAVLGPAPIQPVVVASGLATAVSESIREVLLSMNSDSHAREALDRGLVERFIAVADADYEPVRARIRSVELRIGPCIVGTSHARPFQSIGL